VAQKKPTYRTGPPAYIWTLYFIVAAYWILEGLFIVGSSIYVLTAPVDPLIRNAVSALTIAAMAIGLFIVTVGLGLIFKWEWCRGVVNVFCWFRILAGLWRLKNYILFGFIMSSSGFFLGFFFTIFGIIAAGVQVWLLSETD
jgi:hypothetical protein